MIKYSKLTVDSPGKTGWNGCPNAQVTAGGETAYPSGGVSVGRQVVPAGKKWTLSGVLLRADPAYQSQDLAAGPVPAGVLKISTNGTQRYEARLGTTFGAGVPGGGDEIVNTHQSAHHLFHFGDGITLPASEVVLVTISPPYAYTMQVRCTMTGTTSGVKDIRQGKVWLNSTTADQTVLTFTPASDYILKSINFYAVYVGCYVGMGRMEMDGSQVFATPYLGLGETSCNALDDKGHSGWGMGGIFIPMWGMIFYPGQVFDFFAHAHVEANQVFTMNLFGTESDLTAGAVYPIENDVRSGVDYGPTGADYDGDLVLPAEADVKDGVFYGADGTEYEGEYAGGGGGGMSKGRVVNQ